MVDTGDEWGPNAARTIHGLKPACSVLRFGDLANRPIEWPDLLQDAPEALAFRREPFSLRTHQKAAFEDVVRGFEECDRGKLIMACGTGKTFTALRIAEEVAGVGGRALYLVPSISLFQQSMREWAEQQGVLHRYIGICSDTRAGRNDEDASLQELEIPVTTDPVAISQTLRNASTEAMTVVFCTYHSLPLVERAQDEGAPPFDLVLCDEAHRTTGIDRPEDKTSPFVLVHDAKRIRAAKRLYMTATPRLYTEGAKSKAARHSVEVFSMDDEKTYGPQFHRLPFSRAVEQGLLSDYKVVVFTLSEEHLSDILQGDLATGDSEINLDDVAKIIGCWQALQNPENTRPGAGKPLRLKRAIAFTNIINVSKRLEKHWEHIVGEAISLLPEYEQEYAFRCETKHVDGQHHALERKARIEWLKGETPGGCRILSNARCLSEGIDVPALDAVLFMNPRKSHVDIVQAVGRAMRKAEGKEYGYIILPIFIPAGMDPAKALDDNERYGVVWSILRALRSHDDRLDAEINKLDLNHKPTTRIIFSGGHGQDGADEGEGESGSVVREPRVPYTLNLFDTLGLPPGAIFAKIVEKCGDRKYWETWAKDVADIFLRLTGRIERLLDSDENETLREWFTAFHEELKVWINDAIDRDRAIEMMAQHILTRPVFEALFERYDFAGSNPVAKSLDRLREDFKEFGLENETRDLKRFYESVRARAHGLDNPEARQHVLMELYEKFFATAMKKDADRLGIVYTPVQIVDFILHSANEALRKEFGRSLSDEGVHILDPFTGTGIFLVRLLQSGLIRDEDLMRKYREELHANELVLLAYYIGAIHIEEAFHCRRGEETEYEPFKGIVLTDTFNLHNERTGLPRMWLPVNSERVERQQKAPIQVIVGNPPWSAGQRSAADDNPNVGYPEMEKRIAETYAARSTVTNKNSLYDTYKMAIRWASDRIGEQGVVAFVTNGSWIEGNVDGGVRACLAEEFSSVYVLNLRGHTWKGGERGRAEGGPVFGKGSSATVGVVLLVRNPNASHDGCRILYRDIGDYLKREEKLAIVQAARSIAGVDDWQEITPDRHHDWIGQRDEAFQQLYPMGSKDVKAGKGDRAIFKLFSRGLATGKDAYVYNFSRESSATNARKMVDAYQEALRTRKEHPEYAIPEIIKKHSSNVHWDRELKNNLRRGKKAAYSSDIIQPSQYRPFVKQYGYVDYLFIQMKYQQDRIFPLSIGTKPDMTYGRHIIPDNRTTGQPDNRTTGQPDNRTTGQPDNRTTGQPDNRTTGQPDNRTTGQPDNRTTGQPDNRTTGQPAPRNRAIGIPTLGDAKPFSCVMVDLLPDLNVMTGSQWFPRYRYERRIASSAFPESGPTNPSRSSSPTACPTSISSSSGSASPAGSIPARGGIFDDADLFPTALERVDNITDAALQAFRAHYADETIAKDDIFDYVYGVLHAPAYRKRFANDLSKALPRIPMAPDFHAFAEAGRTLAALHLGYETCEEYPLELISSVSGALQPHHFRLGTRAMRFANKQERTELIVNEHIRLGGIPPEAHEYVVNGRTPLEWFIDRYKITTDKRSGIVNDPNGWFSQPEDLIAAIRRIVHVSVQTTGIVKGLPAPFPEDF